MHWASGIRSYQSAWRTLFLIAFILNILWQILPSGKKAESHPPIQPSLSTEEPPGKPPLGMIWVPGGIFWMGSIDPLLKDARPIHLVRVDGFWMDKTEITNEAFARFVHATGYITDAEQQPNPKEYPALSLSKLKAGSIVFTPPRDGAKLNDPAAWWRFVPGANWKHPEGPESNIQGREKHPVVHITWKDAKAYADWAGKRLPTEAEFEFAARGGLDRKRYSWGNDLTPNGQWQANVWQGNFPTQNSKQDGYLHTAPVQSFTPNGYGLYDMTGNVWEWTSDWYRADYYKTLAKNQAISFNPTGPTESLDLEEAGLQKYVQRGGSFLCDQKYCANFLVAARGKGAPETSTYHVGFRCVKDAH